MTEDEKPAAIERHSQRHWAVDALIRHAIWPLVIIGGIVAAWFVYDDRVRPLLDCGWAGIGPCNGIEGMGYVWLGVDLLLEWIFLTGLVSALLAVAAVFVVHWLVVGGGDRQESWWRRTKKFAEAELWWRLAALAKIALFFIAVGILSLFLDLVTGGDPELAGAAWPLVLAAVTALLWGLVGVLKLGDFARRWWVARRHGQHPSQPENNEN